MAIPHGPNTAKSGGFLILFEQSGCLFAKLGNAVYAIVEGRAESAESAGPVIAFSCCTQGGIRLE
jgi:hypothetical protein